MMQPTREEMFMAMFQSEHVEILCWDTPSKKTGIWQLPNVSSAFKVI